MTCDAEFAVAVKLVTFGGAAAGVDDTVVPLLTSGVALLFNAHTLNEYCVPPVKPEMALLVPDDVVVVPELQSAGADAPDW